MNNPFALFDLPVSFVVDQELLSKRYLTLQKSLHPDNFTNSSVQEQRLALQKSSEINDALQILKDPILRADSIIALHSHFQKNLENRSSNDVNFLMQQMAWREQLENLEEQKDISLLMDFSQEIEHYNKEIIVELTKSLALEDWQQAQQLNDKLRFIKKLLVEIARVEEQLMDFN